MNKNIGIGDRIRKRRSELGISQLELSKQLGVSMQAISLWENGKTSFSAGYLDALSKFLQCDMVWLLTGEPASEISAKIKDGKQRRLLQLKADMDRRIDEKQLNKVEKFHTDKFIFKQQESNTNPTNDLDLLVSLFKELKDSQKAYLLSLIVKFSKENIQEKLRLYDDVYEKLNKNNNKGD